MNHRAARVNPSRTSDAERARARSRLERELGGPVGPEFDQVEPTDLIWLAEAIAEARRREAAELRAGRERALNHIPRLLRGPVRKIVR